MPTATPDKNKSVLDVTGDVCPRATADSYPLYGSCAHCGGAIRCADGSADWVHTSDYRPTCVPVGDADRYNLTDGEHFAQRTEI